MSKRACIFGASGGIGAALVAELAASGEFAAVYTGSRRPARANAANIVPFGYDLCDEATIAAAAADIASDAPLDLVIVATGVLHRDGRFAPEKSLRAIDAAAMAEIYAINTIGPALIAKHFLPLLHRDRRALFAAVSAKVGSISDNRLGGWHSYRASKAALNMLVQNFAIELQRRNPQGIAVTLHPGTVDTALSKPFQGNLPAGQMSDPAQCAVQLLQVLENLTPTDSGGLFAWDGTRLAF